MFARQGFAGCRYAQLTLICCDTLILLQETQVCQSALELISLRGVQPSYL